MIDQLAQYVELSEQIKALQVEQKNLGLVILEEYEKADIFSLAYEDKNIIKCTRKTWTYPQNVQTIENDLKNARRLAEQNGTATYETTTYLSVKPAKLDK